MWLYPDNSRILELSTKCAPAEALQVADEARAFLSTTASTSAASRRPRPARRSSTSRGNTNHGPRGGEEIALRWFRARARGLAVAVRTAVAVRAARAIGLPTGTVHTERLAAATLRAPPPLRFPAICRAGPSSPRARRRPDHAVRELHRRQRQRQDDRHSPGRRGRRIERTRCSSSSLLPARGDAHVGRDLTRQAARMDASRA